MDKSSFSFKFYTNPNLMSTPFQNKKKIEFLMLKDFFFYCPWLFWSNKGIRTSRHVGPTEIQDVKHFLKNSVLGSLQLRKSYPFVVSFDNTPQRPFNFEFHNCFVFIFHYQKMATGDIEVIADDISLLNACRPNLPILIRDKVKVCTFSSFIAHFRRYRPWFNTASGWH